MYVEDKKSEIDEYLYCVYEYDDFIDWLCSIGINNYIFFGPK